MGISTKFTHADLLVMPDDGKRREIIDGEMFVTPSPRFRHQEVLGNLHVALRNYVKSHRIGTVTLAPMDVILSDYDVLEPDLLIVLNEHRPIIKDWVHGAPDLVIEVLSPTTQAIDRGPKLKAYARFGIPEYWIVDPEKNAVEVYRLKERSYQPPQVLGQDEILTSPLLPGLALALREIFEPS